VVTLVLAAGLAACGDDDGSDADAPPDAGSEQLTKLTVTAPAPSLSFLPVHVGIDQGFFEDEGLDVELVTVTGQPGGHVSAVLSGEAWAFLGGPEHAMVANARGAELRSIAALTQKAGLYLVAPDAVILDDPATALRGKRIAVPPVAQSPHYAFRRYLESLGLDPDNDVTLIEGDQSARLAAVSSGEADLALVPDPAMSSGQAEGVWGEPLLDLSDFRPFLQNTVNLPLSTLEADPDVAARFVRALVRAEASIYDDPDAALATALEVYPEMSSETVETAFNRSLAREQWSSDGVLSDDARDALGELAASLVDDPSSIDPVAVHEDRFLPDPGG